jgi:hypothetical protein
MLGSSLRAASLTVALYALKKCRSNLQLVGLAETKRRSSQELQKRGSKKIKYKRKQTTADFPGGHPPNY